MPPVADRPQRADARRNRERILAAAKAEFAETGVQAHMEAVARRAQVGVGTVYRHFPTKEALMGEIVAEKFRTYRDHALDALEHEPDPWEAFAGTLRRNAEDSSRDAAVQHAILRSHSQGVWRHAEGARAELLDATEELIARGRAAGVLRADLVAQDIALVMCGVCSTMGNLTPDGPMDWRRHLELVLDATRAR